MKAELQKLVDDLQKKGESRTNEEIKITIELIKILNNANTKRS